MNPAEGPRGELARRLRSLRTGTWPGRRITQHELAEVLDASPPLISSWENTTTPKIPPRTRLEAYATFFATERSVAKTPYRLITQLTDEEQARREALLNELLVLGDAAQSNTDTSQPPAESPLGGSSIWRFRSGQDVTIVCSELPKHYLDMMPYTDPEAPDYVDMYRYADLDALMELYAHVRRVNPNNRVRFRTPREMETDELTTHLVMLGGVDWNRVTQELLRRLPLPVRQMPRRSEREPAGFKVSTTDETTDGTTDSTRLISPVLRTIEGREVLDEDVGHFYRAPNPYNAKRTVTICNGMYQRGTYGAVRALTDARFRDRNDEYLRTRFTGQRTFSILSRVFVVNHKVITPDWTDPESRLHEWSPHDPEQDRER